MTAESLAVNIALDLQSINPAASISCRSLDETCPFWNRSTEPEDIGCNAIVTASGNVAKAVGRNRGGRVGE